MKLETFTAATKEIFVEGNGLSVSAYPWANCEGVSVLLHSEGEDMPIRASFSLRWEELDALMVALAAVRAS